jgi:hypothetical protein
VKDFPEPFRRFIEAKFPVEQKLTLKSMKKLRRELKSDLKNYIINCDTDPICIYKREIYYENKEEEKQHTLETGDFDLIAYSTYLLRSEKIVNSRMLSEENFHTPQKSII